MPEGSAPALPWVVKLYPRAWQARYGGELAALLAEQKMTFGTLIDLVGGALDARLSPQKTTRDFGDDPMNAERWLPRCVTGCPKLATRQSLVSAAATILVTLALTTGHLLLKKAYGATPAIEAIQISVFPVILLITTTSLYIAQRSWRTQVAFLGFFTAVIYLISLAGAFFAAT